MAGFDENALNDAIHQALNVQTLVDAGVVGGVHHRKARPLAGTSVNYPLVTYQHWERPEHSYTLGDNRYKTKCGIRVVAWAPDSPGVSGARIVRSIAKTIDELLLGSASLSPSGMTCLACFEARSVADEQTREGGVTYHYAGGIYTIEVAY